MRNETRPNHQLENAAEEATKPQIQYFFFGGWGRKKTERMILGRVADERATTTGTNRAPHPTPDAPRAPARGILRTTTRVKRAQRATYSALPRG